MSNTLLSIKNLTKQFGSVTALNNVSLEIKNNEMFALLGPSGCGKTTLLRIIAGFESPDSGQVLINDSDLLSIPTRIRPVNLMFQSYALFPHMDVYTNIAYGLTNTDLSKSEIDNQTNEIIEKIGLKEHVKKKPNQLSGGQQQRVALARAIARKPKLLLLDEPLSALDKKIRQEMQTELKRIQHEVGITFIIVTHDQEEAISLANRIAVFDKGEIKQISTPQELYENPQNEFVADFIGDGNILIADVTNSGVTHPSLGNFKNS
ncbi:MAG: ABC transporter ATP-binding protein, partial [Candidatus Nanopelagicales bacterium]